MNKIVQDDTREEQMANMFNLVRQGGRIGVDAIDENNNKFELKTTTKGSVSTARDLGLNHIEKWRQRYWIIQLGNNTKNGFIHHISYFFSPMHLEGWFSKIEKQLNSDIELAFEITESMKENFSYDKIKRAKHLLHRGKLMNDPNIPLGYIKKNGIIIENDCPTQLRTLVQNHPISDAPIKNFKIQSNPIFKIMGGAA